MSIGFAPLIPVLPIWALVVLALTVTGFALWRSLSGWFLRGLALVVLALALSGPEWMRVDRRALDDIVIVLDDRSASQFLGDREAQTDRALAHLEARIEAMPGLALRRVTLGDDPAGTRLAHALNRAILAEPEARLAGIVLLGDGQIHDADALPEDAPAPVHLLQTGAPEDWDRRLVIEEAPGYGLIGQPVDVILRVEDQGRVPPDTPDRAELHIAIDGGAEGSVTIPVGVSFRLPVTPRHGGANVVSLELADPGGAPPQLTTRNDAAALTIMGVRDRLQVLLVSGEPHAGLRSWRNLLKSDASVDLVHFTILRPPEKFDGVPADELSLIAFPVDELFTRRIDDFDLIIFDRYRVRGILPPVYFDNIRRYVEQGGAVLVSSGPEAVGVEGLGMTPLGRILPARPTGGLIEETFRPALGPQGRHHPVTADLPGAGEEGDDPDWGPWLRLVEAEASPDAQVVLEGLGKPLLVLDRVGEGRVAQLLSDQVWLWGHGFEGGGPQRELLRRIAHWAMAEPELEEEALEVALIPAETGMRLRMARHTLADEVGPARLTAPDGTRTEVTLTADRPGLFTAEAEASQDGLYRLEQDGLSRLIAVGPAAPREFEETIATSDLLAPLIEASGGGVFPIADGLPELRRTGGGKAHGRGVAGPWLGLVERGAEAVIGQRSQPLLPGVLWLILVAGLMLGAWLREGRGRILSRRQH